MSHHSKPLLCLEQGREGEIVFQDVGDRETLRKGCLLGVGLT